MLSKKEAEQLLEKEFPERDFTYRGEDLMSHIFEDSEETFKVDKEYEVIQKVDL